MNSSYKGTLALIGCGDWGKNIARTLSKLGALACIVDATHKAAAVAQELGVPLRSLSDALNTASIKGAVVATPTPTHVALAEQVLSSGRHVFVEKPLAVHDHEISLLENLAQEKGLTLMVGHLLVYHQAFQSLVDLVHSGKLGEILNIETARKNFGKIHAHEGVLWDLGPHDFSMVLTLLQKMPRRLLSQSLSYVYDGKADIHTILLQYEEGPQVQVGLSRLHPTKEQKVMVVGTKGTAVFDDTKDWSEKLILYPHHVTPGATAFSKEAAQVVPLSSAEPLKEEMLHFIECCASGKMPLSPASQAQQVLSLIKAVEKSDQQKEWVLL
jgi:UDP-2-acetamido-3-amino-2,3-dideoxy-glucuronate N-acetyltransferase